MKDESHEGYDNFATFDICVTFDNDQSLYAAYQRHVVKKGNFDAKSAKRFVMQYYPTKTPSGESISKVNWPEVAECFNPESEADLEAIKEYVKEYDAKMNKLFEGVINN